MSHMEEVCTFFFLLHKFRKPVRAGGGNKKRKNIFHKEISLHCRFIFKSWIIRHNKTKTDSE